MNIFFSVAMTKTFQHLKQWQHTPIVSALSLKSMRIVRDNKIQKRPKTTVAFENSFYLFAKPNGYHIFTGDVYVSARFCNEALRQLIAFSF